MSVQCYIVIHRQSSPGHLFSWCPPPPRAFWLVKLDWAPLLVDWRNQDSWAAAPWVADWTASTHLFDCYTWGVAGRLPLWYYSLDKSENGSDLQQIWAGAMQSWLVCTGFSASSHFVSPVANRPRVERPSHSYLSWVFGPHRPPRWCSHYCSGCRTYQDIRSGQVLQFVQHGDTGNQKIICRSTRYLVV